MKTNEFRTIWACPWSPNQIKTEIEDGLNLTKKKNLNTAEELLQIAQDDEQNQIIEQEMIGERIIPTLGQLLFDDDDEMGFMTDLVFNNVDDAEDLLEILENLRYHDPRWKMPFEMDFSLNDLLRDCEVKF